MEVLAQTASNAIQMPVQAACRDVLVPGFDRACQNVFHQVNQTFQRGTQECKCSCSLTTFLAARIALEFVCRACRFLFKF